MAAQNNAALPDALDIAGYHIVKKIGCGGFSIVYRAQDGNGHAVALKEYMPSALALRPVGALAQVISSRLSVSASSSASLTLPGVAADLALFRLGLHCFFDAARALALIDHPNVVRGLDFFRANQSAYLVMAFEAGHSLQHAIACKQACAERLGEAFIVTTFINVIDGVRAVHASAFLHLDLKPANIHLRLDGSPVLFDIGGASLNRYRATGQAPTQVPIFTPGFAPPELQGGIPGPWSDIYGIGAAMFACMLGTAPQPSAERVLNDRVDAQLASLGAAYSGELVQLVRWCLMLVPLARPHSLLALQLRLREIVPDASII